MKQGLEKYPHRSLLKAMGLTDREIDQPIIGVANSYNEFIPGHIHLDKITQAAKAGVRLNGGTPLEFGVIGVCDGLAMHHAGMKYSLPSREIIADSIEIMAMAHPVDGLILVANCDKIMPGMLMGALRLNIPAILISGGPMLAGRFKGQAVDLITVFEGVGAVKGNGEAELRTRSAPVLAAAPAPAVHRQFHELPERGLGWPCPATAPSQRCTRPLPPTKEAASRSWSWSPNRSCPDIATLAPSKTPWP
jgi:dihydroxy-acid dehydratase